MFPIIGMAIVFGSIVGGYLLEKGNIFVLVQPSEFIIIVGAAVGSLFITCPPKLLFKIAKSMPSVLGGDKTGKKQYLNLLSLLYAIFSKMKKEGALGIEKDIESPEKSPMFAKYPDILKNHHAIASLCDNLRVLIVGVRPMELEDMLTIESDTHHEEATVAPSAITKMADSLPGFGIVAAVLGVVITMGKMSEPPSVIGHSVAAALVGTFLGILLCYGFFGPIGSHLEHRAREEGKYLEAIKVAVLSFAKDVPPLMAVEAARRVLFSDSRPSFKELENTVRKK